MDQVFGVVSPFMVMMVVTLLTQWVKVNFTLTSRQIQLVALGWSLLLINAYQLLTIDNITPFAIFSSIIFALLGWFTAIGMYEVTAKQLAKPQ